MRPLACPTGPVGVQALPGVARARRRLTLYQRRDSGYAEARLLAHSMVLTLLGWMEAEQGLLAGPWLDERLARPDLRRVTMLDLFEDWARLTAEAVDSGRADARAIGTATRKAPIRADARAIGTVGP